MMLEVGRDSVARPIGVFPDTYERAPAPLVGVSSVRGCKCLAVGARAREVDGVIVSGVRTRASQATNARCVGRIAAARKIPVSTMCAIHCVPAGTKLAVERPTFRR